MRKFLFIIMFTLCLGAPVPARADVLWFKMLDMMITPLPVDDSSSYLKLALSYLQQKVSSLLAEHENFASYLSVDGVVAAGKTAFELMGGKEETATALISLWTSARDLTKEVQVEIIEPLQKMAKKLNGLRSKVTSMASKASKLGSGSGGGSGGSSGSGSSGGKKGGDSAGKSGDKKGGSSGGNAGSKKSGKDGTPQLHTYVSYVDIAEPEQKDIERKIETNIVVSLDSTQSGTVYEFTKSDFFKQESAIAVLAHSMESRYRLSELTDLLEEINKMDENTLVQSFSEGKSSPSITGDISVNAQLYDIWDKLLALEELIMAQRLQLKAGQLSNQYSDNPNPSVADYLSGAEGDKEGSSSSSSSSGLFKKEK